MKLSNIFEQDPAQAAAMGANALKKTMGANTSGSMVSKALDKLGQGGTLSGPLAKALGPYADALEIILSNPQFRSKFMQMMKQAHLSKKEQPAQAPAQAPNSKTMNAVPGKQESVTEDQDSVDAVASSITRRIMMQHTELLSKYGPVKVMAAIDDVAEFAGGDGLDEIGSSDVSIWTKQVIQDLEAGHYDRVEEEQIDELSKGTLGSYVKKAADSTRINTRWAARTGDRDAEDIVDKRRKGIDKAVDKMTKEEVEQMARLRELSGLPATEGMVDIEYGVDPKLQKLVDIGHLLRKTLDAGSGVKWDDADFNKAANLADALISLGASFGPKNLKDALKLADMDIAQAQDLIAKASQRASVDETAQLDEFLPAAGAALAVRAVGAGASAVTRGIASGVGRVAGSMAQDALDDSDEDPTDDASTGDAVDTVTMDVPLLLRVLEFAREDVEEDMDLHDLAERLIAMSKDGPLSMDDYDSIVGSVEELPAPVDEVSNKTLSSYTDKAAKERDAYHADRNKDAESARKYYNRKAGVRKALSITQEDEQLDELSPQTLGSYVSKSVADEKERRARGIRVRDELRAATGKMFTSPMDRKLHSPTASRKAGQKRAIDKLTGASKVPAKEGYYTPGPETMPGAVGPQENTTVSFNQSKTIGDATLNINASAKDMEELHRILKLAGINYDSDGDTQEPSMQDVAVALEPHTPEAPAEEPCGCEDEGPTDVKYSTDKQTLINVLRDKLQKRLA